MNPETKMTDINKMECLIPFKKVLLKSNVYGKIIMSCLKTCKSIMIGDVKKHRAYRLIDGDISKEKFIELLSSIVCPLELVSIDGVQSKPCADLDKIIKKEDMAGSNPQELIANIYNEAVDKLVNAIGAIANSLHRDNVLCVCRGICEHNGEIKVSFHFVINGFRVSREKMHKIMLDAGLKAYGFDMMIYSTNWGLHPIYSCKKINDKKEVYTKDILRPYCETGYIEDNIKISDYCPSYIEEGFIDLDKINIGEVNARLGSTTNDDAEDDAEDVATCSQLYAKLDIGELVARLKHGRADHYEDCTKAIWAIINCSKQKGVRISECRRYCDEFCQLSDAYDGDWCDDFVSANFNKTMTGRQLKATYLLGLLKEDDPEYYERMYGLRREDAILPYNVLKVDWEKTHAKILHPCSILTIREGGELLIECVTKAKESYHHIRCLYDFPMPKGGTVTKTICFFDKWLDDHNIKRYDRIDFIPPPLTCPDDVLNLFTGFEIFKTAYVTEDEEYNNSIIERFVSFAKNLFGEQNAMYMLSRFAYRLQSPAKRTKVSCMLYSQEEGCGKNAFYDIIKGIFGTKYFQEIGNAKIILEDKHTCVEEGKLFIVCNETNANDTKSNFDKLKDRITSENLTIRRLFMSSYDTKNYNDYDWTTNNINALRITKENRRFYAVEVTTHYLRNHEFFTSLYNDIISPPDGNKRALRVIAEWLMNFNVEAIVPNACFQGYMPITELMQEMTEHNEDCIVSFIKDMVVCNRICGRNTDSITIYGNRLFDIWSSYRERNRLNYDLNQRAFLSRLGRSIKREKFDNFFVKKQDKNHVIYIVHPDLYKQKIGFEREAIRDFLDD